jgi:hypothetical protein
MNIAGSELEWDENTKGISKKELIQDFMNELKGEL